MFNLRFILTMGIGLFLLSPVVCAQDAFVRRQTPRLRSTRQEFPPENSIGVNRDSTYMQMTVEELLRNVFIKTNACSSVNNISAQIYGYNNTTKQWTRTIEQGRGLAYFNKLNSTFPMGEGLIMSTGNVHEAEGVNRVDDAMASDIAVIMPGDADLSSLITTYGVTDAAVVEFDFVPTLPSMEFDYIFASEEYPEWVNSQYNDVFGFFVSDPSDISKPKVNIARLPTTETATDVVSINNVNSGSFTSNYYTTVGGSGSWTDFSASNRGYFIENPYGSHTTEFDGYTHVLRATFTDMVPCHIYHLKLAVGNVSDRLWGSSVFLKANSFSLGNELSVYVNGEEGGTEIFKTCDSNYIHIQRPSVSTATSQALTLVYAGPAVNGTHFTQLDGTPLPTLITIPAGLDHYDIWFKATNAAVANSHFDVSILCPCAGGTTVDTHTVHIYEANTTITSTIVERPCAGGGNNGRITVSSVTGGSGQYEYSKDNGITWQTSNVFSDLGVGTYNIAVRSHLECYFDVHQVELTHFGSDAGSDITQCSATFTMNGNQPQSTIETGAWTVVGSSAGVSIANSSSYNTTVTLDLNQRVTATLRWTLSNGVCSVYDDVNLQYRPCSVPVNRHLQIKLVNH